MVTHEVPPVSLGKSSGQPTPVSLAKKSAKEKRRKREDKGKGRKKLPLDVLIEMAV